jgi:Poly(R)-hydroxyalkanoic acid synthase subunit (PHA_synth_III_E)
MSQASAPQASPSMPDFSQFWRPILGQGMDLWQKAAAQGGVSPEFTQQWKAFLDQWIDAWAKALGQAMGTEGFAQALGRYLDQTLAAQGPMRKGMEQYTDQALRTLGLPSRGQMIGVASQLVALEERIEGLEDRLDEIRMLLTQAGGRPGPAEGTHQSPASGGRPAPRPSTRPTKRPREAE